MKLSLHLTASFLAITLVAVLWTSGPARAQSQPVHVIEMFTSQGCSSCPPADRLLKSYAERSDVIALSFHVDYWDRLGWKDTFGSPAFTQRQRAYALQRGDGQVYTPQAVINGRYHEVGSNKSAIERALASTSDLATQRVPIAMSLAGGKLVIKVGDGPSGKSGGGVVTLLGVQAQGIVTATRGENSGERLAYSNIVRGSVALGAWNGARFEGRVSSTDPVLANVDTAVVLVQRSPNGPIVAAAKMSLK